jgi:hypothetical protein
LVRRELERFEGYFSTIGLVVDHLLLLHEVQEDFIFAVLFLKLKALPYKEGRPIVLELHTFWLMTIEIIRVKFSFLEQGFRLLFNFGDDISLFLD